MILFIIVSPLGGTFAKTPIQVSSAKGSGIKFQTIPYHPPSSTTNFLTMGSNGLEVNPKKYESNEPAPMGITDYGVNSAGAYEYTTDRFEGIATINSLSTNTSSDNPQMTIQLNVNLAFTSNGEQYVYWIQDVAYIDTSVNDVAFLDNVWNSSATSANLGSSGLSGNGQLSTSNGQSFYYDEANSGDFLSLQYPATITLIVTCGMNILGQPYVNFEYNDGGGFITYDVVTFLQSHPVSSFSGFVVNGYNYNPAKIFYDAELILGGLAVEVIVNSLAPMCNCSSNIGITTTIKW